MCDPTRTVRAPGPCWLSPDPARRCPVLRPQRCLCPGAGALGERGARPAVVGSSGRRQPRASLAGRAGSWGLAREQWAPQRPEPLTLQAGDAAVGHETLLLNVETVSWQTLPAASRVWSRRWAPLSRRRVSPVLVSCSRPAHPIPGASTSARRATRTEGRVSPSFVLPPPPFLPELLSKPGSFSPLPLRQRPELRSGCRPQPGRDPVSPSR